MRKTITRLCVHSTSSSKTNASIRESTKEADGKEDGQARSQEAFFAREEGRKHQMIKVWSYPISNTTLGTSMTMNE